MTSTGRRVPAVGNQQRYFATLSGILSLSDAPVPFVAARKPLP